MNIRDIIISRYGMECVDDTPDIDKSFEWYNCCICDIAVHSSDIIDTDQGEICEDCYNKVAYKIIKEI